MFSKTYLYKMNIQILTITPTSTTTSSPNKIPKMILISAEDKHHMIINNN